MAFFFLDQVPVLQSRVYLRCILKHLFYPVRHDTVSKHTPGATGLS